MPFIARPAGGQIIDPAWGTLVADAVVMRFATTAQRSSQLTAPVTGQLTTIDTRPGILQYWNGTAWTDTAAFTQAGAGTGLTDANGIVTVTFPVAFAGNPTVVASYNGSGAVVPWRVNVGSVSTTTVFLRFYNEAGVVIIGSTVGFTWIAVGLRA
jgi:hypothetical protein